MSYEIIEEVKRCRQVVDELMTQHVISADAEGINLGRDGPLTLLQIGTRDGHVYLFDVMKDKNMFKDGGLKTLLESSNVMKVFHACSRDSEALWFQFGVKLQNLFDTQVAHMLILEKEGRLAIKVPNLKEICELYMGHLMENKDDITKKWNKSVIDYWEQRPLNQEMIDYACEDVRVLLPEMHEKMKRKLEEHEAMELFKERVVENINLNLDDDVKTKRRERNKNSAILVLKEMSRNAVTSVTTDDQKEAMNRNWYHYEVQQYMSKEVERLYYKAVTERLSNIQNDMVKEGNDFDPEIKVYYDIITAKTLANPMISQLANKLYDRFKNVVYADIIRKYKTDTPIYYLRDQERMLLRDIHIDRKADERKYSPVLVSLMYRENEERCKSMLKKLHENPSKVSVSNGYYSFLHTISQKTHIPSELRKAATDLKKALDQYGKNPSPSKRPKRI